MLSIRCERGWWYLEDAVDDFGRWVGERVPHKVFRPRPESRVGRFLMWLHSHDWQREGTFCAAGWQAVGKVTSSWMDRVVANRIGAAIPGALCVALLSLALFMMVGLAVSGELNLPVLFAGLVLGIVLLAALPFAWMILAATARYICPLRYELPEEPSEE